MNDFLQYENGVMSAIRKMAGAALLGILWIACSLPIFTIGASSTAFYYAYNKVIRNKRGYAWSAFFFSFKENFKLATSVWIPILGIVVVAVFDIYILSAMRESLLGADVLLAILIVVLVLSLTWSLYLFPYLARFDNSKKALMKNSFFILLANMPWSILLFVIFMIGVVVSLATPILNLFLPAVYMFFTNPILERIFKKYMTPEERERQIQLEKEEA